MRKSWMTGCIVLLIGGCNDQQTAKPHDLRGWAFPEATIGKPPSDEGLLLSIKGTTRTFTWTQIHDRFNAVNWFPDPRAPIPREVLQGRKPDQFACGYCHMPDGVGRPENSALAGLPQAYLTAQIAAFANGTRKSAIASHRPGANMERIARNATADEIAVATRFFSEQPFRSITTVVETETIPAIERAGFGHRRVASGKTEALGARIIELPNDQAAFDLRDPRTRFTAFVPPGSLTTGARIALGRGDASHACIACHGPGLAGNGLIPGIAGRSPTYLFRQLYNFRAGTRAAPAGAPMREVVKGLADADLVAVAAWAASQPVAAPSGTR